MLTVTCSNATTELMNDTLSKIVFSCDDKCLYLFSDYFTLFSNPIQDIKGTIATRMPKLL